MPNSILEAGAAGLPVISTRHAGIATAVIQGKTGFLVEELGVNGMTDRMIQSLTRPKPGTAIGTAVRQHIRANGSVTRHIRRLQVLLENARA